jgi:hypothetical protein
MFLKPSPVIACTALFLPIALLTLATAQERRHAATIPRSDEPRQTLDPAGTTTAGYEGLEVDSIGQKRREA